MPTYSTTEQPTWDGWPVQAWEGYPLRTDILERIKERVTDIGDRHCRVMVMRYDLHFHPGFQYPSDHRCLRRFINSFTAYLHTKGIDLHYIWAMELGCFGYHYHLAFLVDGRLTRCVEGHLHVAEKLWAAALGIEAWCVRGLVYPCPDTDPTYPVHNGEMLARGDTEKLNQVFYWLSYLAKEDTKDVGMPLWAKRFGCSQLRKRLSA